MVDINFEDRIAGEIREWSAYALEKPNENYNGFPACPFAAKAWADDKVAVQFKYDGDPMPLYTTLVHYDDTYELIIMVDFDYDVDQQRFHGYLEGLNECIAANFFGDRDLYVMGFHPEDESNEIINDEGFETDVEESYAMIFVQRLSLLCKASKKLMRNGYYNREAGGYAVQDILAQRNALYRRLKPNGA